MAKVEAKQLCPFTIGDTLELNSKKLGKKLLVFTDIVMSVSEKNNTVNFKYEFNNSGKYMTVDMFNEEMLSKVLDDDNKESKQEEKA